MTTTTNNTNNTNNNADATSLKYIKRRLNNMLSDLPAMNGISMDFISDNMYDCDDIPYLRGAFYDYAGSFTPVYYGEIEEAFTPEMLDNYISDTDERVTIESSSDLNKLKMMCIYHDFECQLFEDTETIIRALYLYALLEKLDLNANLVRDLAKLTDEQITDIIDDLIRADDDAVCFSELLDAISYAVEEDEEEE